MLPEFCFRSLPCLGFRRGPLSMFSWRLRLWQPGLIADGEVRESPSHYGAEIVQNRDHKYGLSAPGRRCFKRRRQLFLQHLQTAQTSPNWQYTTSGTLHTVLFHVYPLIIGPTTCTAQDPPTLRGPYWDFGPSCCQEGDHWMKASGINSPVGMLGDRRLWLPVARCTFRIPRWRPWCH